MAKARVAPLKRRTILRLELAAAALSVKVNKMLQDELPPPTDKSSVFKHPGLERPHKSLSGNTLTQREILLMIALEV